MEYLLARERSSPISLWLLREAHRILLTGVRGEQAAPGQFRDTQNWIGSPGDEIHNATYVPPPPKRLQECLDAFAHHLGAPRSLPPLMEIACLHYQFEAIHPFRDGNGRVGRLLVALLPVEWGLLPGPLLDLSAYIEPRLVDALFERPAITIGVAQQVMGVSHRAATVNIEKLAEEGLLVEIAKSGRTRRFVASEIIQVINGEARRDVGARTALA